MKTSSKNKFLSLGFSTDLIDKIEKKSQTLSGLRGQNKKALLNIGFSTEEVEVILTKVNRAPIETAVLNKILRKSAGVCCYCADGNRTRPYQIHHIKEYHIDQDNREFNLLLVCPTHHVVIHTEKLSIDSQLVIKRKWENLSQIIREYELKGLQFPFKAFEYLDYQSKGSITEIFSFSLPKPSLCKQLFIGGSQQDASKILEKHSKLILSGPSGSGKSTLAIGIAGTIANSVVYKYTFAKNTSQTVEEILLFLSFGVKPIVLIIDDANVYLTLGQIEQITATATSRTKIIIVNTLAQNPEETSVEHHLWHAMYPIAWSQMKDSILKILNRHETEVIDYLKVHNANAVEKFSIGTGSHQARLKTILLNYSEGTQTAWQYLFNLSSGINEIDRIHVELINKERLDLLVLYIAILQISKVETGVTREEVYSIFKTHSALNKLPPPSLEWLDDQLKYLLAKRMIKNERGRYNTMHREFAINFLGHCYFKSQADTEELLMDIFSDYGRVNEIAILWAWIDNSLARDFIKKWVHNLTDIDWAQLIDIAVKSKLSIFGLIVDKIHMLEIRQGKSILKQLQLREAEIATAIEVADIGVFYHTHKIFLALTQHNENTVSAVIDKMNVEIFISKIKKANPFEFEEMFWLFNSIVGLRPDWIKSIGEKLSRNDFDLIIAKIEPGDIDSLMWVIKLQRSYIHRLKRSQFKFYVQRFSSLLKNCSLEEIKYSPISSAHSPLFELFLFPKDIEFILGSLNIKKIAKDLENTTPRNWGNILSLGMLSGSISSKVIENIINQISTVRLKENIDKYEQCHYELRVLIYQLCYGGYKKRIELAKMLYPIVAQIVELKSHESSSILEAYFRLSPTLGRELLEKNQLAIPLKENPIKKITPKSFLEAKIKIEELEEAGEDYYLDDIRVSALRKALVEPED